MTSLYKRLYKTPGPKRILALDGGGIRGALTLGYLEKIEKLLQDRHQNPNLCLCDYFDLIVGTSTGGIIAAGLAMGMRSTEIKDHYLNIGGEIFKKRNKKWMSGPLAPIRPLFLKAEYDHRPLEEQLNKIFKDTILGDQEKIKTGLSIVTKRADTFSTWPIHNLPKGKFHEQNKGILIRDLLRATSAAPSYFIPKEINVGADEIGVFIDGGMSLANNPGFQAFMIATFKGFSLKWPLGDSNLSMVSIGTGSSPKRLSIEEIRKMKMIGWAGKIPYLFMEDASYFNQILLQLFSKSKTVKKIDGEIEGLVEDSILGHNLLTYTRYNVDLSKNELQAICKRDFSEEKINSLREMDHTQNRFELAEIGVAAAEEHVKVEHFPKGFDLSHSPPLVNIRRMSKIKELHTKSIPDINEQDQVELMPIQKVLKHNKEANLDRFDEITQDVTAIEGLKVFISYAKENETELEILLDLWSPIHRSKKVDIFYDLKIDPKKKWHEDIQQNLLNSKAIIILVSRAYLGHRKNYIFDHEIPLIKKLHESGKVAVFPIMLERAGLTSFSQSELQHITVVGKTLVVEESSSKQDGLSEATQWIWDKLGVKKSV